MALISTAENAETGVPTWEDGPTVISEESAWKLPVRVASVGNVNLGSVPTTLDGIALSDGDRLGIFSQSTPSENGIYERVNSTTWQRTSDFESGALVQAGVKVYTKEGSVNAKQTWRMSAPTTGTITVGTTSTTWELDPGSATTGWSSVTVDENSTASSAKYNVFEGANYPGALDYTDNTTPQNVTFLPASGRFRFDVAGTFLVAVTLVIQSNSTTGVANLSFDVDGVEVYTTQVTIHSTVDPVERTIGIIVGVSATSYIECFIASTDADTMQIMSGTTCNILAAGGSLDAAVDLQAAYNNGNTVTISNAEGGPIALTTTPDETDGALTLTAGNHTVATAENLLAITMDDNSNAGAIKITNPSTQSAGSAIDIDPTAAGAVAPQIDLTWPSVAYTGTPGGIKLDYSALGAADWDSISASFDGMLIDMSQGGGARNLPFPVYGLRLKGRPSNSSSDQVAIYIESALGIVPGTSWDWGILTESHTRHATNAGAGIGDSGTTSEPDGNFIMYYATSGSKPVPALRIESWREYKAGGLPYTVDAGEGGDSIYLDAQRGGVASGASNAVTGGRIFLTGGDGGAADTGTGSAGQGGTVQLNSGDGGAGDATIPVGGATAGAIQLVGGTGGAGAGAAAGGDGGDINLTGGTAGAAAAGGAGDGGDVNIKGGVGVGASAADRSGNVNIDAGLEAGSGVPGSINIGSLSPATAIAIGTNSVGTITIGDGSSSAVVVDAGTGGVSIDAQGAGAINIGTSGDSGAVNLGTSATGRLINIGNPLSTEVEIEAITVDINAGLGGFTLDTTAGISLDATGSNCNFTVDGGTSDLTLESVGGQLILRGGQAASNAVRVETTHAAGGIDIAAGTAGISVDSTGNINISSTGAGTDVALASFTGQAALDGGEAAPDAILIVASNAAGGVDIDAGTGGITLDSTGAISLDAVGASNFTTNGVLTLSTTSALDASGNTLALVAGNSTAGTGEVGGSVTVDAGDGAGSGGTGGAITLTAGDGGGGASADGGNINLIGGASTSTNGSGGDITLTGGLDTGSGTPGKTIAQSAVSATVSQVDALLSLDNRGSGTGGGESVSLYTGTAAPTHSAETGSVFFYDDNADGQLYLNVSSGGSGTDWDRLTSTNGWVSETMTGTFTASAAKVDVFASGSWSVYSATSNVTANNLTYVQVWSAVPLIHSSVDPVERTISLILTLAATDYVNVFVDSTTASTITVVPGTTMNMNRIG
jgi:hypothetical protein